MLKTKKTLAAFIVLAVVAVVFRTWQLIVAIDFETGFFYSDAGFWSVSLYAALIAGIAAFLIVPIFDKKSGSPAFVKTTDGMPPRCTLVMGFAFLAAALIAAYNVVLGFGTLDLSFFADIAVCLSYFAVSFIMLSNKSVKPATGYISLVLAIAFTARAASMFMSDTIIARESDQLLIMLSLTFAVFFFLAFGRFLSKNEAKHTRLRVIFCVFFLALTAVSQVVPNLLVIAVGPEAIAKATPFPSLHTAALAIVSIACAFCLYSAGKPEPEKPVEAEQTPSENV